MVTSGSDETISPRLGLSFFLRNARLLMKMRRTNRKKIERAINSTERMDRCLIPTFEGTGGPMEEGMVYLMFNSEHGKLPVDSVFRLFWVNSPSLHFSFLDSFLISKKLISGRWERKNSVGVFQTSKHKFHQEVKVEEYEMVLDGSLSTGYSMVFVDRINGISGGSCMDL